MLRNFITHPPQKEQHVIHFHIKIIKNNKVIKAVLDAEERKGEDLFRMSRDIQEL